MGGGVGGLSPLSPLRAPPPLGSATVQALDTHVHCSIRKKVFQYEQKKLSIITLYIATPSPAEVPLCIKLYNI